MYTATFLRKQQIGPSIWEFFFTMAQLIKYQAGQYVHVTLPDIEDERGNERTFTLTSLPGGTELSFAVKFPQPQSAYKAALLELRPGDTVGISQAMGDLVLPRDPSRPLVFVAGGLGIASFVSMMKQLAAANETRPITLLYGHRPDEQLFDDVTAACPGLTLREFVSPDRIAITDVIQTKPQTLYYISGSEPFTMSFRDQLLAHGVTATSVAYDYFDGYTPADL